MFSPNPIKFYAEKFAEAEFSPPAPLRIICAVISEAFAEVKALMLEPGIMMLYIKFKS